MSAALNFLFNNTKSSVQIFVKQMLKWPKSKIFFLITAMTFFNKKENTAFLKKNQFGMKLQGLGNTMTKTLQISSATNSSCMFVFTLKKLGFFSMMEAKLNL